ncbi:hypothetical protein L1887_37005 [Cichorium endivia]|nr:hypothetical protein L1887_37005 [Cichorium endivia]
MDSSKPQHSHPGRHSRSRTGSGSRNCSSAAAGSKPDLGDYVTASASSAGNNEPGRSKTKRKKRSTGGEPKEDDGVDIGDQSTPRKRYQSKSLGEKDEDTTTRVKEEKIEEHGVYANTEELDKKMDKLQPRFVKNEVETMSDINVVGGMGQIEVNLIIRLSDRIWREKDDEDHKNSAEEKTIINDDHGGINPNDSEEKTNNNDRGGVNPKGSEDSHKQESGDDRGDDHGDKKASKDLKDWTEELSDSESDTKDLKDSSSDDSSEGETDDESDTEVSISSSSESSDGSDTQDLKDSSSNDSSEEGTDDENDTEVSRSSSSESSDGSDTKDLKDSSSNDPSEGETDDESDPEVSTSSSSETSDGSHTIDSSDSSSEDSSESKTDDGSNTKQSSSTGSQVSSETETDDDHSWWD